MALEVYQPGQGFEVAVLFYDKLGVLADPTTVEVIVTDPAGADVTYTYPATITRLSVGSFVKQATAGTLVGLWTAKWVGTGLVAATPVGHWLVADDRE